MAKDIKIYKDENEMTINETQLENFLALGWKGRKLATALPGRATHADIGWISPFF